MFAPRLFAQRFAPRLTHLSHAHLLHSHLPLSLVVNLPCVCSLENPADEKGAAPKLKLASRCRRGRGRECFRWQAAMGAARVGAAASAGGRSTDEAGSSRNCLAACCQYRPRDDHAASGTTHTCHRGRRSDRLQALQPGQSMSARSCGIRPRNGDRAFHLVFFDMIFSRGHVDPALSKYLR